MDGGLLPGTRVGYVGDGRGDLCACCTMRACDTAFVRTGYPLERHAATAAERGELTARIAPWEDGDALHRAIAAWLAEDDAEDTPPGEGLRGGC